MKHEQAVAVSTKIAEAIAKGAPPWHRPWSAGLPICRPLQWNGKPYRGVNSLGLWAAADTRGFQSPYWMTFRRAHQLGAHVKKGAKSELSFFASRINATLKGEAGEEDGKRQIYLLKAYPVFNADEVADLPAKYSKARPVERLLPEQRLPAAETVIAATGARIETGGGDNRAYYIPSLDTIHLPEFVTFDSPEAYYRTAFHELTHWSGHEKRLNRDIRNQFGDSDYAAEELVAELGSAFCTADLGLASPESLPPDHASYIAGWLKKLGDDPRWIFRQCAAAEKASRFIAGAAGDGEEEGEQSPDSDGQPAAEFPSLAA